MSWTFSLTKPIFGFGTEGCLGYAGLKPTETQSFSVCFFQQSNFRNIQGNKTQLQRRRIGLEPEVSICRVYEHGITGRTSTVNAILSLLFQHLHAHLLIRSTVVNIVIRFSLLRHRQRPAGRRESEACCGCHIRADTSATCTLPTASSGKPGSASATRFQFLISWPALKTGFSSG